MSLIVAQLPDGSPRSHGETFSARNVHRNLILDFTEIPRANAGGPDQDAFELFAQETLNSMGYRLESGPSRGQDGGCDLITVETPTGPPEIRWLVSCKHYAYSGLAVGREQETDIRDRLAEHRCEAFLAFYSTLPSSSLERKLQSLGVKWRVLNREHIERHLLTSAHAIAKRFMPVSFGRWISEHPSLAVLFKGQNGRLYCQNCQREILQDQKRRGLARVQLWCSYHCGDGPLPYEAFPYTPLVEIYWCCKGACSDHLSAGLFRDNVDVWLELRDLTNPASFFHWQMNFLDGFGCGGIPNHLQAKVKELLFATYPYVARDLTEQEVSLSAHDYHLEREPQDDVLPASTLKAFLELLPAESEQNDVRQRSREGLCQAWTSKGRLCSRKAKYGAFCGHHKQD